MKNLCLPADQLNGFMKEGIRVKLINLPLSILLLLSGVSILLIAHQGIADSFSKIIYMAIGFLFILASVLLLYSTSRSAYIYTIIISVLYIILFLGVTIYVSQTDETGQGLIGVMLLSPQVIVSLLSILFSVFRMKRKAQLTLLD